MNADKLLAKPIFQMLNWERVRFDNSWDLRKGTERPQNHFEEQLIDVAGASIEVAGWVNTDRNPSILSPGGLLVGGFGACLLQYTDRKRKVEITEEMSKSLSNRLLLVQSR